MAFAQRWLEASGGGGGGTLPNGAPSPPPSPPTAQSTPDGTPIATNIQTAIAAAGGDKERAIRMLIRENHRYRERHRTDETTIANLTRTQVPHEGFGLTKEQKAQWDKLVALGNLDEIIVNYPLGQAARATLTAREKRDQVAVIAKLAGFNADVLADLAEAKGLTFERRNETVDGQTIEVPFVKGPEQDAAFSKLTEYVDAKLAGYKPALMADAAAPDTSPGQGPGARPAPTGGTSFPTTPPSPTSASPRGDAVDQFITQRNAAAAKRSNPLVKSA